MQVLHEQVRTKIKKQNGLDSSSLILRLLKIHVMQVWSQKDFVPTKLRMGLNAI